MGYQEIIQQLEFFRDIGIESVSLRREETTSLPTEVTPPPSTDTLEAIRADIGDCQRCKLAPTRTTIVFGSGNPNAEIVFGAGFE